MANVSGKDGSITFSSGYSIDVTEWTVDCAAEEVEGTSLGDKWKDFFAGVKEWSGSYTALADDADIYAATETTVGRSSPSATSQAFYLGGAAATATFYFAETGGTADDGLTGTIFITGVSANAAVGGTASSFTFTFRGDGTLSHT
jgi:hypothetical protein